jgi:hypothetical protein
MHYRYIIIATVVVNSFLTFFYEKIVIWYLSLWWKGVQDRKKEREFHEQILKLQDDP